MILQVGQILDQRYRVEKFIGSGGMAEVYKVWDAQRAAFLALKLLNADLAEDLTFVRRFQKEAQALHNLTHPHIVRFYDLVEADQLTFFLMDYVDGITLRSEIFQRRAPFTPERILEIYQPICSALYYAHNQGVIHCDIKPANIMVESSGRVLLADFGIARLSETVTTSTSLGSAGTPAYMAPELVEGLKPRPATDVYSLGIILFELLSGGQRPFTGEAAQITGSPQEKVRWEQVHQTPPPVRAYNPQVSADVEQVLLRCLAKDPAARFATTQDLLKALGKAFGEGDRTSYEPANQGAAPRAPGYPEAVPEPIFHSHPSPPIRSTPSIPSAAVALPPRPLSKLKSSHLWRGAGIGSLLLLALWVGFLMPGGGLFAAPATQTPEPTQAPLIADTDSPSPTSIPTPKPTPAATLTLVRTKILPTSTPATAPICTAKGQTWIRVKDKSTMVCVPSGSFPMGYSNCREFWCQNEANQGSVDVSAFWIDQNEITNAQFQQFVNDTGFETGAERSGASEVFGVNQPVPGANWRSPQGSGSSISGKADHPVVQINWFAANAFCKWAGGRLPSEAQWEKSARGTDGRIFPWGGDMPDSSVLNAAGQEDGFRYTAPVGSFPAGISAFGLNDMAGNAFEWTRSYMKSYPYIANDGREADTDPGMEDKMVLRGGSFYTDYGTIRSTWRAEGVAQRSTDGTGFRCVIDR